LARNSSHATTAGGIRVEVVKMPQMQAGGTTAHLMALAAGSTIAGNLTILGAASNVIIIQQAEARGETLTFMEFVKVGVPLTLIQMGIYGVFLGVLVTK